MNDRLPRVMLDFSLADSETSTPGLTRRSETEW